jgi:hypothetical protein
MSEWDANTEGSTPIRPTTLTKLHAVAVVREMDPLDVLDEAVEAARAKLSPRARMASEKGPKRGPKAAS